MSDVSVCVSDGKIGSLPTFSFVSVLCPFCVVKMKNMQYFRLCCNILYGFSGASQHSKFIGLQSNQCVQYKYNCCCFTTEPLKHCSVSITLCRE